MRGIKPGLIAISTVALPGSLLFLTPSDASALSASAGTTGDPVLLPDTIELVGVVRDFKERSEPGGHQDFERPPSSGFGHYYRIAAPELDEDDKPEYYSGGFKRSKEWQDKFGNKIMPPAPHYPAVEGDKPGSMANKEGGAVYSEDSFSQWFRDVPGVNLSKPLPITLVRKPGTNVYVFDDRDDPIYDAQKGFFPINGELYGNSKGDSKNFHFTYELDTEFIYREGQGQVFTFRGDDDVWVFIDGKMVIDIGGVHSAITQSVFLDRLDWLEDGETYQLKFFFAERHRTQSNFRIETTLNLKTAELPTTTALHD